MFDAQELSLVFWHSDFWLPHGLEWENVEPRFEYDHTNVYDLYFYTVPFAVVILLFRYTLETYCFKRIGLLLGIKVIKNKKAPPNSVLEKAYKASHKWNYREISSLSKKCEWTERQIERWLRLRRLQGKPSTLVKFTESCWRCFYCGNMSAYGLMILWDKQWFWNLDYCWINYPHQALSPEIWWYYMISLSYYLSVFVSQFTDTRYKDFWWMMFVHHTFTVVLLASSWICNLFRIGCVILFLHDVSDALLEFGKVNKYAKNEYLRYYYYFASVITWIVARVIFFGFWVLISMNYQMPKFLPSVSPVMNCMRLLTVLLFSFDIFWAVLICRSVQKTAADGKVIDIGYECKNKNN